MSEESPILMFNALWFKPDGGAEMYREYGVATRPLVARYGGKKRTAGVPTKALIGDFDADLMFFVEWPSWTAFKEFVNDPEYVKIRPLRENAITNSLLIRCDPV